MLDFFQSGLSIGGGGGDNKSFSKAVNDDLPSFQPMGDVTGQGSKSSKQRSSSHPTTKKHQASNEFITTSD